MAGFMNTHRSKFLMNYLKLDLKAYLVASVFWKNHYFTNIFLHITFHSFFKPFKWIKPCNFLKDSFLNYCFFKFSFFFFFFVYMEIKPELVPIVVMETIIVPLAMCLILQQRRSLNKLRDLRCFSLERYQDFWLGTNNFTVLCLSGTYSVVLSTQYLKSCTAS